MQDETHDLLDTATDEKSGEVEDVLSLSTPDDRLVEIIDQNSENYKKFYEELDLFDKRKKNERYIFGEQIKEKEKNSQLKSYESKNLDNVLYEIEATIKPLAMSQLPDLIVMPGKQTDEAKTTATLLSDSVNSDVKRRKNRKVLAMAFKHLPVYYTGIIKARWNAELAGGQGDYEFIWVHPDYIEFDYTATESDADKMEWISHLVHSNVQKILMMFPKKKEAFIAALKEEGKIGETEELSEKHLATAIDYKEVWFTDYQKQSDGTYKKIEAVCWKYKKVILGKMKNPYFDYEGAEQLFTYENPALAASKRPLNDDEMQLSIVHGIFPKHLSKELTYHNYFDNPRKPFFFMTYDQWGKQPLDATSRIEQNIPNQDNLDKRGKQINETLNNRGHHVWSKLSGLKPSDIQKMDHNNPNLDYLVDGQPGNVHEYIAPERPTAQEFQDIDRTQQRMYGISGSTAVRGEIESDVATTNQIAREANYTRADDLVEDTINPASEWMAVWALQFIKWGYTQEHFRKMLGKKGEVLFLQLHQNIVDNGMEVMIKASGTDKIKKQNNAMEMAKMQLIDPLTFYEDMDLDDPEGRTAKLVTFQSNMPLYLGSFVESGPTSTQELAAKLQQITMQQQMMGQPQQQPGAPGQPAAQGQPPTPQGPTPTNTAAAPVAPPAGPPQGSPAAL